MNILVTGASGFIGYRLANQLAKKGHSVTGLVRSQRPENTMFDVVVGDLGKNQFEIPDKEYDVVFHLAAAPPMEKNKKVLENTNYSGTVNLFNSIKNKTKFLIYCSGLGVFGELEEDKTIDENSPLNPNTEYATKRLKAQRFLESACSEHNIAMTVAYLGEVYGSGGWFKSIIVSRLKKGNFKLPGKGEYFRSLVHIDDAVNALELFAENSIANERYIVTDSLPVKFNEFISFVCSELGVKTPGSVPPLLVKSVLGGDFVKLLTTSVKANNAKLQNLYKLKYPTYKDGIPPTLTEIQM